MHQGATWTRWYLLLGLTVGLSVSRAAVAARNSCEKSRRVVATMRRPESQRGLGANARHQAMQSLKIEGWLGPNVELSSSASCPPHP